MSPVVSVIIPAHNESAVIGRSIHALLNGAEPGELEVYIICNGCTDDTADRARQVAAEYGGDAAGGKGGWVRVLETPVGSKPHALNLGDEAARAFPRVYADADVSLTSGSLRLIVEHLRAGKSLAAAPRVRWDLTGASWAVRAFYAIDGRLPSSKEGIGGTGVYALSEAGRRRFGAFPLITADDAYVRRQFTAAERATVEGAYSVVTPPRNLAGVIAIKTRSHYGNYEIASLYPHLTGNRGAGNRGTLLRMLLMPWRWPPLCVYLYVKAVAKARAWSRFRTKRKVAWERDETSRRPAVV